MAEELVRLDFPALPAFVGVARSVVATEVIVPASFTNLVTVSHTSKTRPSLVARWVSKDSIASPESTRRTQLQVRVSCHAANSADNGLATGDERSRSRTNSQRNHVAAV